MKSNYRFVIIGCWFVICGTSLQAQTLDVTRFGAIADGRTLNTKALQAAIDSCSRQGGGTVFFPAGRFLTGSLYVKSNVTLELSAGAVLLGSENIADYVVEPRDKRRHLLYAHDASNIAIIGQGTIDGQGKRFWKDIREGDTLDFEPVPNRPLHWLRFVSCSRIKMRDVQLVNSPSHVCYLDSCFDVSIDGVTLLNDPRVPNTDGFDISDCSNVRITNCLISTGDDAICLKGNGAGVQNILVSNCVLESDDAALKLGTGSLGVIENCLFTNCIIRKTRYGIALFMIEGGKHRTITFQNITIEGGSRHPYDYPIFVDVDSKDSTFALGTIENISFHDIIARTQGKILIAGHPKKNIVSVSLRNITLEASKCATMAKARKPKGNRTYNYEDRVGNADFASVPALIVLGYADRVRLDNLTVRLLDTTALTKTMLWVKSVQSLLANELRVESEPAQSLQKPVISASQMQSLTLQNADLRIQAPAFLECYDTDKNTIKLSNNLLFGVKELVLHPTKTTKP